MIKIVLPNTKFFKLLLVALFISNFSAYAQQTTIWVVRHAEKDTAAAANTQNPGLSAVGLSRAKALSKKLQNEQIKAIYVSKYKRTAQTSEPLAKQDNITLQTYGDDFKSLASNVLKDFSGSNVLIIGHSNTVVPILTAFGAEPPFEKLEEKDYDMLFKITIKASGPADLDIYKYGKTHHKTEIPDKYLDTRRTVQPIAKTATNY